MQHSPAPSLARLGIQLVTVALVAHSHTTPISANMNDTNTPATPRPVRVATWNLLWGRDAHAERLNEAAEHLRNFDIILLQEARLADGFDATNQLADMLGMTVAARANTVGPLRTLRAYFDGSYSQTAILTRFPVLESHTVHYPSHDDDAFAGAILHHPTTGRAWIAATAHLAWGANNEGTRLNQAIDLDLWTRYQVQRFSTPEAPAAAILGGDFNALPDSDTLRYLTGRHTLNGRSTLWLDTWTIANPDDPGYTSSPDNLWALQTARNNGITHPEQVPHRRIDYLLTYGWAYGRPGYPLEVNCLGDPPATGIHASDHLGLRANLQELPGTTQPRDVR